MPFFVARPRARRARLGFDLMTGAGLNLPASVGGAGGGLDISGTVLGLANTLLAEGVKFGSAYWQQELAKQFQTFTTDQQEKLLGKRAQLEAALARAAREYGQEPEGSGLPGFGTTGGQVAWLAGAAVAGIVLAKLLKLF